MNIVDKQIKTYNEKDLNKFLSCYSSQIKVKMLGADTLLTDGIGALEKTMSSSFENDPTSHTEVISRIIQGNLVVNQEKITNHGGDGDITSLSVYAVQDNKIVRLYFGGRVVEE